MYLDIQILLLWISLKLNVISTISYLLYITMYNKPGASKNYIGP